MNYHQLSRFIFLLCVVFSQPTYALRCGHYLVDIGDYKSDIYDKCGEPDDYQSHYEKRGSANHADGTLYGYDNSYQLSRSGFNYGQSNYREVEILVEELIYGFGRARFHQLLRFENGRLIEIESLGKHHNRR